MHAVLSSKRLDHVLQGHVTADIVGLAKGALDLMGKSQGPETYKLVVAAYRRRAKPRHVILPVPCVVLRIIVSVKWLELTHCCFMCKAIHSCGHQADEP